MSDKKPVVMITEFPDGIVIGWDFCTANNGGCGNQVSQCSCKDGRPKEPRIFHEWRTGSKAMPDYGKSSRPTTLEGLANGTQELKVSPALQKAVADAADATAAALDDPRVLEERIKSLEALADEELSTNGKTAKFDELKGKLEALYSQRTTTTEVPA